MKRQWNKCSYSTLCDQQNLESAYPFTNAYIRTVLSYITCSRVSTSKPKPPSTIVSWLTFPCTLEKEPHDENLQPGHGNHHTRLHDRKIEYPLLCTPDRAEVPVFSCSEVLLHAIDGGKGVRELEDAVFDRARLFGSGSLLCGEGGAVFVFDL